MTDSDSTPASPSDSSDKAAINAQLELERFLPYRLNVLANKVSQSLSRIYADLYNIGIPEWRILVILGQFGEMTGKAVGLHTHMHKTKVSRAIAALEADTLVGRRASTVDRREALFALTSSGKSLYDELAPVALEFGQRLVDGLDEADHRAFDRVIDQLLARSELLAAELAKRGPPR